MILRNIIIALVPAFSAVYAVNVVHQYGSGDTGQVFRQAENILDGNVMTDRTDDHSVITAGPSCGIYPHRTFIGKHYSNLPMYMSAIFKRFGLNHQHPTAYFLALSMFFFSFAALKHFGYSAIPVVLLLTVAPHITPGIGQWLTWPMHSTWDFSVLLLIAAASISGSLKLLLLVSVLAPLLSVITFPLQFAVLLAFKRLR